MYLDDFVQRANKTFFENEEACHYMLTRGFSLEDIKRYNIGCTNVVKIRKEQDPDYKDLHDRTYKFKLLQGRLIFPCKNLVGRVNGMVVRSISEKRFNVYLMQEAKKIGAFFGLCEALPDIIRTGKVFVHEAAMDCMSFAKVFPNTISTLTSFINEEQIEVLSMLASKIILVFDEDDPGRKGIDILKYKYPDKKFESISLGYHDSNSCLISRGRDCFEQYIKSKVPVLLQD